jgi:DNA recombination protein RmuC
MSAGLMEFWIEFLRNAREGLFMPTLLETVIIGLLFIAGLFAFLAFLRAGHFSALLRSEIDRAKQAHDEHARNLRQELNDNLRGFQDTTLRAFQGLGETLSTQVRDFAGRLDAGIRCIDERVLGIGTKLDQSLAHMAEEACRNRDVLRQMIEAKLDSATEKQGIASKDLREEMISNFRRFTADVAETLTQMGLLQKERLENVTGTLTAFSDKQEQSQDKLKRAVEERLDTIRAENATKLDEMRKTVDEKLHDTLEKRLGESFKLVSGQLEQVFRSVGEMKELATGVGDLKKVLTNVKSRGTWGEVSLGNLLEQIMAPDQYGTNVEVKPSSGRRVEYAIRLPGGEDGGGRPIWLPIDAKFPTGDYERLQEATERADVESIDIASKALEACIRGAAKDISEKYVHPPHSTDFAVMFLPSEGLFAETIRRAGLSDVLQRDYRVVVAGPTTLMALLNSLRMGFRSLAIQNDRAKCGRF